MTENVRRTIENLAEEFADLPLATIVQIVTDLDSQQPSPGPAEIELTARTRLHQRARE